MHLDVSYQNRYNDYGLGTVLIFLDCKNKSVQAAQDIFGSSLDCFHKKQMKKCEDEKRM